MESVWDDDNSVFHEDLIFFKSDTFESHTICVTFEIFRKYTTSVWFDANNDLQEYLKIFKSNTFENYKTVEVQNLCLKSPNEFALKTSIE